MSTSCRLIVKDNTAGVVVIRFRLYFLLILSLLMGFASISTDMYLPAMPAMSRALHAAKGMIELTVSGYLIGFSLGQLLWGPISDKYGRKPIIAAGIVLFITGAAGCALSQNIQTMIGWRVVQAIGASSCVSLSRRWSEISIPATGRRRCYRFSSPLWLLRRCWGRLSAGR